MSLIFKVLSYCRGSYLTSHFHYCVNVLYPYAYYEVVPNSGSENRNFKQFTVNINFIAPKAFHDRLKYLVQYINDAYLKKFLLAHRILGREWLRFLGRCLIILLVSYLNKRSPMLSYCCEVSSFKSEYAKYVLVFLSTVPSYSSHLTNSIERTLRFTLLWENLQEKF